MKLHAARAARRHRARSPATSCSARSRCWRGCQRIMEQLVHAWDVLATMTPPEYTAIRPVPRRVERLPELAVPLHRVPARQQERGDAQAARAPARPAGRGAGGATTRPRSTTRRCACWRAAACRCRPTTSSATGPQPYAASDGVEQAWLVVYRDPEAHWDLYQLGEELTDLEDTFRALALPPRDDGRARDRLQARHGRHRRRELSAQDARRGAVPRDLEAAHGSLGMDLEWRSLSRRARAGILAELVHRRQLHALHPSLCRTQRSGAPVSTRRGRCVTDRASGRRSTCSCPGRGGRRCWSSSMVATGRSSRSRSRPSRRRSASLHGIAYAAVDYTLAPRATLSAIVDECRAAVA